MRILRLTSGVQLAIGVGDGHRGYAGHSEVLEQIVVF